MMRAIVVFVGLLVACQAMDKSAFQLTMQARAKGQKKAVKKAPVRGVDFPDYTRQPEPGVGPLGQWYVRDDPNISPALPWVSRPTIGDGNLVGDFGFDPFGLSKLVNIQWLRNAELKHGRVCMLASVGLLAPELVQRPEGFKGIDFVPAFSELSPYKALTALPPAGIAQIIIAIALIELTTAKYLYNPTTKIKLADLTLRERALVQTGNTRFLAGGAFAELGRLGEERIEERPDAVSRVPGDLGWDPLGLADNGIREDWALAEIKHARLAMIGTLGMMLQAFIEPNKPILQQTIEWAKGQIG